MKNNEKVVEATVVTEETKEVVTEGSTAVGEVKKSVFAKPAAFFQKHGKKLVAGVALVAVGAAGFMLGRQVGTNDGDTYGDDGYTNDGDDSTENTGSDNNTNF